MTEKAGDGSGLMGLPPDSDGCGMAKSMAMNHVGMETGQLPGARHFTACYSLDPTLEIALAKMTDRSCEGDHQIYHRISNHRQARRRSIRERRKLKRPCER